MNRLLSAILAGVTIAAAMGVAPAAVLSPGDVLKEPLPVRFRLADNVRVEGTLTEWDRDSFNGSFGKRYWHELRTADARRLFYALMDRESAADWVNFGRMLMLHDDTNDLADAAFTRARQIDPAAEELITAAREEAKAIRRELRGDDNSRDEGELPAASPEAHDWPADLWPELSEQQAQDARLAMIADAERILESAKLVIEPVESEFFIVCSDSPRREVAEWAVRYLDKGYRAVAQSLGIDEKKNIFWGKPVVFIVSDEERFREIEASAFGQHIARDQFAITHYEGPKVFINAYRQDGGALLHASLRREVAHGFLHRFRTPRRLPPWANEGFAEYFAQQVLDESIMHDSRREEALRLVRSGFPAGELLQLQWNDGTWQGRAARGYPICHLMIDYLMNVADGSFPEWVESIKTGTDWKQAMIEHFHGTPEQFIDIFVRFYRVNN